MKRALLILWAAAAAVGVFADQLQVAWDASPDANGTNGIHYFVYWQATAPTNGAALKLDAGPALQAGITNISPGWTYGIWVTAADTNGIESEPSNVVSYSVPDTIPSQVILLSAKIVQTNKTFQIKVDWQPAPFQESVTGYKLDILQDGILATNLFTTNTSAQVSVPMARTQAVLSATNYQGWGRTNLVGDWRQPQPVRMEYVFAKKP